MQRDSKRHAVLWLAVLAALAIAFFAIAVSNAAYETTSPFWLTFHVLLRKSYSVVAFGIVGFALARATRYAGAPWGPARVSISVALYSALIELGQRFLSGAHESIAQQSFDVACGLLGGLLGALVCEALARRANRKN